MSDTIIEFGKEVRAKLLENGFDLSKPVEIGRMDFEGSGDSGYVQALDCTLHSISEVVDKYSQDLENWGNEFVDSSSPGWENNEGGEGCVLLSIDNDEIKAIMEMSQRFCDTTNEQGDDCISLNSDDEDDWKEIVGLWATNRPNSDKKLCIKVSFEGSGDSGSIDDIAIYNEGDHHYINNPVSDDFMELKLFDNRSVGHVIEDWAYAVLDRTGVDWYNNEGGEGYINVFIDTIVEEDGDKQIKYEWSIDSRYGDNEWSVQEETFNLAENGGE